MSDATISLTKIKNRIAAFSDVVRKPVAIRQNKSFYIYQEPFAGYIDPFFTQQPTSSGTTEYDKAKIILISAPGATGKSAMTKNLSNSLKVPIFDLGAHEPVGSFSLLGMLYNTLEPAEMGAFIQGIQNGYVTLLIDAIDEGYVKAGHAAFNSFLMDIAGMAKNANGLPFIMFGRTNILEYTSLLMEENGVPVTLLQIEPFSIKQARQFIDNQMNDDAFNKYQKDYTDSRDFIIQSIEGFFKNENDVKEKLYHRFIGYAPVLQSIAFLLNQKNNYHLLLNELKNCPKKNIELVVSILSGILERERTKFANEIGTLLDGYPASFASDVRKRAYSIEEQCIRILQYSLGVDEVYALTDDEVFNAEYSKKSTTWVKEHPFLEERKFRNVVFESFSLANVVRDEKLRVFLKTYMAQPGRGVSYMFFDLYRVLHGEDQPILMCYLPYLIESFQMMDRTDSKGEIVVIGDITEDGSVDCDVSFVNDRSEEEYIFSMFCARTERLELGDSISNLVLDAPICLSIDKKQVEFVAPVSIHCCEANIVSEDLVLTASGNEKLVVFVSEVFNAQSKSGKLQTITKKGNANLGIVTDSMLFFPFVNYQLEGIQKVEQDPDFREKYQKLRHVLLHFRSRNKDKLAKYKCKISNRICKNHIAKAVLAALLESGVLAEDETMYYINQDKLSEVLGVNFSGLRTYEVTDKLRSFLASVKS